MRLLTNLEIEAFLAIVEHGTLTKAAEVMFISQPALSKHIHRLEKELGFCLLNRKKGIRRVSLTEKGKFFVSIANRYKDIWSDTKMLQTQINRKKFKIFSSDGPHLYILSDAYKDFARLHQDVSLKLYTASYTECFEQIQKRNADIAFTGGNLYYKNVISVPAYSEKMYFICRKDSDYPNIVHPQDLCTANAIFSPYSSDFYAWFNSWFHNQETPFIEAHLIAQVEDFMVSFHRNIWTIVPSSVKSSFIKNPLLTTKELQPSPPDRVIYLVKRMDRTSNNIDSFLRILKTKIATMENVSFLIPTE